MNRTLRLPAGRLAVIAAALLLALASPAAFAAWDLQQLMESLARNKSGRATFVETKHIAMLSAPLVSWGELLYTAPDKLEKRTLKPKPETMAIDGDMLSITRGRQKFELQLQAQPELAAFIDSIRGTLAGDRGALERSYRLSLEGSAESWVLQLVPTDNRMKAVVQRIRISGVQGDVKRIEIEQADGDSSLMAIEKSTPSR
jgi:outer membrane lipoprotein-sorting protein